jgi:hypothetical protein
MSRINAGKLGSKQRTPAAPKVVILDDQNFSPARAAKKCEQLSPAKKKRKEEKEKAIESKFKGVERGFAAQAGAAGKGNPW